MSEGAERVARHHASQKKRGLKLVKVWVPKKDAPRIRDQAKAMRAEAGIPLPEDNAPPFPGWAYLRVEHEERELLNELRRHGARWLREQRVWRLRADLVDELGVRHLVIDSGPGSGSGSLDLNR